MGDFMNFLKSFIAGLFTIVFGILVFITICIFNVSNFATKENIMNKMKQVDLLTEVKKIKNSGSSEGSNGVAQIVDEMYSLASQFSVSEEVVDQIIDSNFTKEIIGEVTGNLTDYVINGKNSKVLSEEDVYKLIDDNLDDVLKENDIEIDDGQKEKFLREVKKQLPDIVKVIPSFQEIMTEEYKSDIKVVHNLFSFETKIILCVCLTVSGLVIIILKRKEFEWCVNMGIALLLAGLVTVGISFIMPSLVIEMMNQTDLSLLATSLTNYLTKPILYSGIGALVIAIILFIVYKLSDKIKS